MSKKYPDDFYCYGIDSVRQTNEEIDNCVRRLKKDLKKQERENPDDYTHFSYASGDTIVIGYRTYDCKVILVCRNYQELRYSFKE